VSQSRRGRRQSSERLGAALLERPSSALCDAKLPMEMREQLE
jgi:hypothetical protein